MGQGGLAQAGRPVEQNVVQRLTPALGRGDGDIQVALDFVLSDEVIKVAGTEAGIQRGVLGAGLT